MQENEAIQLIECPRDAMQGWKLPISTALKVEYLNALLEVGFHSLDFGSFVSPKAIPQMADTADVVKLLKPSKTKLLSIVANERGAQQAMEFEQIHYLGFPFSISPTFQQRNTNSSMEESLERVENIQELCLKHNRELVIYLSMGFGNPYGDEYDEGILLHWTDQMVKRSITIISLADTVGVASPEQISFALHTLVPQYPQARFGVHLHSTASNRYEKMQAAFQSGCLRFDGALKGIGGCPMASDTLVGNMDSGWMISFLEEKGVDVQINREALEKSLALAGKVFSGFAQPTE